MVRNDDDACALLAHQLDAKATELEAGRKARAAVLMRERRRRRDESARRAVQRLDELAQWRLRLHLRAQALRDGREWAQPVLSSTLKFVFRATLVSWLLGAVWSGELRFAWGLLPLVSLWGALFVELRR